MVASSIFIFLRSLCMRKCLSNCGILSIPISSNTSGSMSPSCEQFLVAIASHITRPLGLRNAVANPGICVQRFCAVSSRLQSFVHSPCKNFKVSRPLQYAQSVCYGVNYLPNSIGKIGQVNIARTASEQPHDLTTGR